ncbi:MAG: TIGR02450 family Trp-rich protein [Arenicella sp.]|jgi:tryptophan-rich hypothetical protein|nr:TIGR02450 family Trp-rich protein [Arenicella sp.]HAU68316.1 TIGR02450 family Trp-rich protein [Gammaproteobacteria bacterium]
MNTINPKKLLHSKWTAVNPQNKEKHFIVAEVEIDEDQTVMSCVIEAVYSKRQKAIEWTDLKNSKLWRQGWV